MMRFLGHPVPFLMLNAKPFLCIFSTRIYINLYFGWLIYILRNSILYPLVHSDMIWWNIVQLSLGLKGPCHRNWFLPEVPRYRSHFVRMYVRTYVTNFSKLTLGTSRSCREMKFYMKVVYYGKKLTQPQK